MRKKYTRIHAIIFAAVIILSAMPLTAFSAEPGEEARVIRTKDPAGQESDPFSEDGILLPEAGINEVGEKESPGEETDAFEAAEEFEITEDPAAGGEETTFDAPAAAEDPIADETAAAEDPIADETVAAEDPIADETAAVEDPIADETTAVEDPIADEIAAVEETVGEEPAASEADLFEEEEPAEPTVDEIAQIETVDLFLTDKIGLCVHVALNDQYISGDNDFLAFTCAGRRVEQLVSETWSDDQDRAVFTLDLAARQMTDQVTLQMNVGGTDGTPVNCSVRTYADAILAGTEYTEQEKEMVRAMLNYGSYTQLYAGYNTDSLAAAGLYEEGQDPVLNGEGPDLTEYAYSYELKDQEDGLQVGKASLLLGTDVSIRFYYQPGAGKTAEDYLPTQEGYLENDMILGYDQDKDMYYAEIVHISPLDLGRMYTLVIYEAPEPDFDNPIATVTFGALSYCRSMIENEEASDASRNLSRAIYNYYEAANAF